MDTPCFQSSKALVLPHLLFQTRRLLFSAPENARPRDEGTRPAGGAHRCSIDREGWIGGHDGRLGGPFSIAGREMKDFDGL